MGYVQSIMSVDLNILTGILIMSPERLMTTDKEESYELRGGCDGWIFIIRVFNKC